MKPSSLPAGYADEINLNEKLSDADFLSAITKIEKIRADAAKYKAEWDTDIAFALTQKSHQAYEALKIRYPVMTELKAQWNKVDKDAKKLEQLEAELIQHNQGTESIKQQLHNRETYAKEQEAKINDLKLKLNRESPHAVYRQAMVDYAKRNDESNVERIESRAISIEALIKAWKIKEDTEGVSITEVGLKTASRVVQEKALTEAFGDKLKPKYWRPDHQGNETWTKKVQKKDIDAYGDVFWEWELWSNEQLNAMCTWIKANFPKVTDNHDELYILQMINPGLFEGMWMKDKNWSSRQWISLRGLVDFSFICMDYLPSYLCGLFLIQNCK